MNVKRGVRRAGKPLRVLLDLVMTILLLYAYAYRITGDAAHEWIGVSVLALFILHTIINRRWYKNLRKGAYTLRRGVMTAVNLLLVFTMAALVITGLLQSRTVLAFLHLPGGMALRQIHTTAAYWLLLLIGMHLGLHWGLFIKGTRKIMKINPELPGRTIVARMGAVVCTVFGMWPFFDRAMFAKLFLGFSFDYWSEERPAILFFVLMLSIMGMYVFITYYGLKI
ncbi:MAG: DUF4405 domain-containing protein [Treponema sp.]|jgi:hypothetical protein|nr:DUF4405 domain-containing protein [Treponema sp.]